MRRAVREHDVEALHALDASATVRDGGRVQATLALARYTAAGLADALPSLRALCRAATVPTPARARACALAGLHGAPPTRLTGFGGSAPWYRGPPFPVVDVAVGGAPPAPMIVDTGASETLLSRGFCERHGIRTAMRSGWPSHDASGASFTVTPAIVDLRLGELCAHAVPVGVATFPARIEVAGLLAPHRSFPGCAIVFDDDALHIVASEHAESEHRQHRARFFWNSGLPIVLARAGGRCALLVVDSGSPETTIDPRRIEPAVPLQRRTTRTFSGRTAVAGVVDVPLALGDAPPFRTSVFSVRLERSDEGTLRGAPYQGLLGFPWLRRTRAIIDPGARWLYFGDPVATSEPPSAETG